MPGAGPGNQPLTRRPLARKIDQVKGHPEMDAVREELKRLRSRCAELEGAAFEEGRERERMDRALAARKQAYDALARSSEARVRELEVAIAESAQARARGRKDEAHRVERLERLEESLSWAEMEQERVIQQATEALQVRVLEAEARAEEYKHQIDRMRIDHTATVESMRSRLERREADLDHLREEASMSVEQEVELAASQQRVEELEAVAAARADAVSAVQTNVAARIGALESQLEARRAAFEALRKDYESKAEPLPPSPSQAEGDFDERLGGRLEEAHQKALAARDARHAEQLAQYKAEVDAQLHEAMEALETQRERMEAAALRLEALLPQAADGEAVLELLRKQRERWAELGKVVEGWLAEAAAGQMDSERLSLAEAALAAAHDGQKLLWAELDARDRVLRALDARYGVVRALRTDGPRGLSPEPAPVPHVQVSRTTLEPRARVVVVGEEDEPERLRVPRRTPPPELSDEFWQP